MSIKIMTAVWSLNLTSTDKIVLLALADNANDEGHCYPSVSTLVKKCGLSERSVQGVISRLSDDGHLTRNERAGRSTIYVIHPRSTCTPQELPPASHAPTPAAGAPPPPQLVRDTPAAGAPITIIEPSIEPSPKRKSARRKGADTAVVQSIFVHWKTEFDHEGALLTPKREKRITDGLKNFTAEQLRDALSGYKHSKFHLGDNPEGKRYDDIELFFRTGEKIETGLQMFAHPPRPPPEKKLLSPVERVMLANGGSLGNERVVSEQNGRGDSDLGDIFGDVRGPPHTGLRRIGT